MRVNSIELRDFRSFTEWSAEFNPRFNIVFGANGSGKTSLLEAIHYLARGKTFTSSQTRDLLRKDQTAFELVGKFQDKLGNPRHVGHRYSRTETLLRLDAVQQNSRKMLAEIGPLSVIAPSSASLVRGGPSLRRTFLDQYLFHVEPSFSSVWSNYRHLLSQHNACLQKNQISQLSFWREKLAGVGESLNSFRLKAVSTLAARTKEVAADIGRDWDLEIAYRNGWDVEQELLVAISDSLDYDLRRGSTQRGPHRAELKIRVDGRPDEQISNGEAKLLSFAMILARHAALSEALACSAPIIIDDLTAELDRVNSERIIAYISSMECQVFMSQLEQHCYDVEPTDASVFHVEH